LTQGFRGFEVSDKRSGLFFPKGTQVLSGAPATIPVKFLVALGTYFEALGFVSEASIVQVQFTDPGRDKEKPHLAVEVQLNEGSSGRYAEILPEIEQVIKRNYPSYPVRPVDLIEIGREGALPKPLSGSQLFFKSIDGKSVPL
jgi:hypothetical protein